MMNHGQTVHTEEYQAGQNQKIPLPKNGFHTLKIFKYETTKIQYIYDIHAAIQSFRTEIILTLWDTDSKTNYNQHTMKTFTFSPAITFISCLAATFLYAQDYSTMPKGFQVDTRIDNMGYWQQCSAWGLVPVEPYSNIPPAVFTGTKVLIDGVLVDDSPDVPVTTESVHESENSIVVDPNNLAHVLNSNNSGNWPSTSTFYGANYFHSFDEGLTWTGSIQGAGGGNQGDPAACMNMSGRYFIGFINNGYGQGVAYSDNNGATWSVSTVANGSIINILDKNHLWVDNSPTSPFEGYLFDGWMENNNIQVSRSITNGTSWEPKINISQATAAGSHNQGINFKTGPDGEVYAAWSVYDNWPGDEKAIGFARSLDGGITWQTAVRALNNIRGIRTSGVSQNQRVNSFPSMAVDISNSPYRGHIYIVWSNIGVPGVNTGTGCDVYMMQSTDEGLTWSTPMKINMDAAGQGKTHYFPWITCDQANGNLSIVYYDNRNVPGNQCETWMAWSQDGGATWEEMKVSDVSWTPSPIPGMASGYFGDYLGITAYNGKVYPCWTDNRIGHAMTYVSPIDLHIPVSLVVYDDNVLNDTTYGNGNGIMDFGETILLGLKLVNNGDLEADSVMVTLSTGSPFITFEDSTEYYGTFGIGESKTILDAFKYSVSEFIPDGTIVPFQVTAVNALDSVTISFFTIEAHAPAVTILGMSIDDATGNNNHRLDPGEQALIKFLTKNTGDYDALDVVSTLESSNPFVYVEDPEIPIGTLLPGQSVYASFPVTVSSATPWGSATVFHNTAAWEFGMDEVYKMVKIGLIVEDWETGNFLKFPWQFTGMANWVIDPDTKWEGNFSARSGNIPDGQISGLLIQYNVLFDDTLSFYRKISSEKFKDILKFYIDSLLVGYWSGEYDFLNVSYPVLAGPHIFKWVYEKDGANAQYLDHAWVDYIVFPPEYKTAVSAGADASVCEGSGYQLMSAAFCYDSLLWTTSGTGSFSDPTIYNPIYTPSQDDISAGSVVLTITAFGFNGATTSDQMILTIIPMATADAGPDGSVCANSVYLLDNSSASNYNTLIWASAGDGIFDDPHLLHPAYTPGAQDIGTGSVALSLIAGGNGDCPDAEDQMTLAVLPVPVADLGVDTSICAHLTYTLDASTPGATGYLWSPGGQTTAVIIVDSTGIGIGSQVFSVVVTGNNGCEGTDSVRITFKECAGINELAGNLRVSVSPNPNQGTFTLTLSSLVPETVNLHLIGTKGEKVMVIQGIEVHGTSQIPIHTENLPDGSYVGKVFNAAGQVLFKIIIQR
jgi:hypothetical protein